MAVGGGGGRPVFGSYIFFNKIAVVLLCCKQFSLKCTLLCFEGKECCMER